MQKTQEEAREYAQWLANIHREPRVIVKLPESQREYREIKGVPGDYYGGVRLAELRDWYADGCVFVDVVNPQPA